MLCLGGGRGVEKDEEGIVGKEEATERERKRGKRREKVWRKRQARRKEMKEIIPEKEEGGEE